MHYKWPLEFTDGLGSMRTGTTSFLKYLCYSIFQNQGTPSSLGATLSCLLASCCFVWVFGNFQRIIILPINMIIHFTPSTYMIFIKNIVQTNYNQFCWQSKGCMEVVYLDYTRQSKQRQNKASHHVVSARKDKKVVPWFWKILYICLAVAYP